MSVNISLNNVLNQGGNHKFSSNSKVNTMDKSTFIKMIAMMMSDKTATNLSSQSSNIETNLNIDELLAGSNAMDSMGLNNANKVETNKEEKLEEEKLENLLGDQNFFNFIFHDIMNSQSQADSIIDTISPNHYQDTLARSFHNLSYKSSEEQYVAINNEPENNAEMLNVDAGKNLDVVFKENSSGNFLADKLIAEIQDHRDKLINEIDFQVEMMTTNKPLVEGQNKIINVSDESTQLKSQVLSQVKDKIIFMAEEGTVKGNTIKNVTMELHPVNLGKVDIKMTFENNQVTVEIKALNEETQKIISSNVDELANILGKSSEAVNIVVKSPDYRNEHQLLNYNHNSNQNNEQNFNQNDQSNGHGRQNNNYYNDDETNNQNNEDDSIFSQLINLRSIKLNA